MKKNENVWKKINARNKDYRIVHGGETDVEVYINKTIELNMP